MKFQLDAKKSPLALLAQTCSQIGADTPSKPLISGLEKSTKTSSGSSVRSPPAGKPERTRSSPSDSKSLAFKPYETNVVSKKSTSCSDEGRPASKTSVHSASGQESVGASDNATDKKSPGIGTPTSRKSISPGTNSASPSDRKTPADRDKCSASPAVSSGASPIVRSGMEVLGQGKDSAYKAGMAAFNATNPLCCPPNMMDNPAFRAPYAGASAFSHQQAAAAAALLGYSAGSPASGPYLSYARVKTPAGAETLVPVCKDPYCTNCPYSMHNAQLMMGGGSCPSGCTQCDHQKYGFAMAMSPPLGPMPPPTLSYPGSMGANRPYVCNWVAGESYCGKRFATSDELLQHLRTHTSLATADSAAILANPHHPLLSPSASSLHRAAATTYPAPSLSPLSARYHPYGKPPSAPPLPASLAASPFSAFNTLGPYAYSPYAIYAQRIGAAVHP